MSEWYSYVHGQSTLLFSLHSIHFIARKKFGSYSFNLDYYFVLLPLILYRIE